MAAPERALRMCNLTMMVSSLEMGMTTGQVQRLWTLCQTLREHGQRAALWTAWISSTRWRACMGMWRARRHL
jgi:hypothetical protein